MITVRLMGGLGNQLFQYAAAYSIAKQKNTKLFIDKRFYAVNSQHGGYRLDRLQIPELSVVPHEGEKPEWKIKAIGKLPKLDWFIDKKIVHESRFKSALTIPNDPLLLGYWQNLNYFSLYMNDFRSFFVPLSISDKTKASALAIHGGNSVSVHVRRGDYVSNPEALKNHGICSAEYYKTAINYILETVENPVFFVFSDDVPWVENNLGDLFSKSNCFYMKGNSQEEDLWLMSNAKHHIIANSSFSWWGAYLASNESQKVVSPFPWFDIPQKYTFDPSDPNWKRFNK